MNFRQCSVNCKKIIDVEGELFYLNETQQKHEPIPAFIKVGVVSPRLLKMEVFRGLTLIKKCLFLCDYTEIYTHKFYNPIFCRTIKKTIITLQHQLLFIFTEFSGYKLSLNNHN